MANIPFKSITFPGLPNKYTVPEISNDLMTQGKAADAKATGDALALKADKSTTYWDRLFSQRRWEKHASSPRPVQASTVSRRPLRRH